MLSSMPGLAPRGRGRTRHRGDTLKKYSRKTEGEPMRMGMSRRWRIVICLLSFVLLGRSAVADPIQLLFHEVVLPGPSGWTDGTVSLPDLSHGGSIALGAQSLGNSGATNDGVVFPAFR